MTITPTCLGISVVQMHHI